ncbi:MAG TPA: hypothetical protein ENK67_04525 [Flavobacteriia bacterium]|nr:hypothetical protein [Flavobacteriia bacterium]
MKISRIPSFLLFIVMISFQVVFSQNENKLDSIKAQIKYTKNDNIVSIYGTAINQSNALQNELGYTILVLKKNNNKIKGKSLQSGKFSLMNNKSKILSKHQVNIENNEQIVVYLYLKQKEKPIAKDSISIKSIEKKYSLNKIDEKDIEFNGLIVENVMTKLGKDFYDYFNQIKMLNNVNYPFNMTINEKPAIGGRNSEVNIVVNDDLVYRFRTQPNDEFLYTQAKIANKQIYNYYVKQKILRKKMKLY